MPVFLPSLKSDGYLNELNITIFNIGSRKLSSADDYADQGWKIFAPNLAIYGFDADADACEAANTELKSRNISWKEVHLPFALDGKTGESTLYVTQHPMCSSLYPPNELFLSRFNGLPEFANLDFTVEVETITLDELYSQEKITSADFLQIDVQGAELDVLKGASNILEKNVLAIQIEVEFASLYCSQPLFHHVDAYLRNLDFSLFDLQIARRIRKNSPIQSKLHPGQILWGEGFYFRDLISKDCQFYSKEPEDILKLACIADVMNFTDYALEVFEYLILNYGQHEKYNVADQIVKSLTTFPSLTEKSFKDLTIVKDLKPFINNELWHNLP